MGAGFKVEVSELDGLVRELYRSQEEMRAALNAVRDTGPRTTGSKELDNACDRFHDSWDEAIKKIARWHAGHRGQAQADSRHVPGRRGGHPGRLRRQGRGAVSDQYPSLKAAIRPDGSLDPLSWWAKGPALAPSLPGTVSGIYDSVTGE